jgi:hypothetical protein
VQLDGILKKAVKIPLSGSSRSTTINLEKHSFFNKNRRKENSHEKGKSFHLLSAYFC